MERPVPEEAEEPAAMEQYRKEVGPKRRGILMGRLVGTLLAISWELRGYQRDMGFIKMGFHGILWGFHVI